MTDNRARVPLAGKRPNLAQLSIELGVALCASDLEVVVAVADSGVTTAQLAAALAAHVVDPLFAVDEQVRQMVGLKTKAQSVWAGTDTFTAAQVQGIVAAIVIRASR